MKFEVKLNNRNLTVELINKKRMKHCYLTIKNSTSLQIRANSYFSKKDANKLIEKKEDWLIKNIIKLEQKERLRENNYFLGEVFTEYKDKELDDFYRTKSQELLPKMVEKNSQRMNLYPTALKFRKNKTRFGSCSSKNSISLNILLMKYPLEVIEYVVIHELAHIKHKNHSRLFWNLVEQYCPNYKQYDKMLKMF